MDNIIVSYNVAIHHTNLEMILWNNFKLFPIVIYYTSSTDDIWTNKTIVDYIKKGPNADSIYDIESVQITKFIVAECELEYIYVIPKHISIRLDKLKIFW